MGPVSSNPSSRFPSHIPKRATRAAWVTKAPPVMACLRSSRSNNRSPPTPGLCPEKAGSVMQLRTGGKQAQPAVAGAHQPTEATRAAVIPSIAQSTSRSVRIEGRNAASYCDGGR